MARYLVLVAACLWAGVVDVSPVRADVPIPPVRRVENLTKGIRFLPPFLTMSVAPSDPKVIYVGTAHGYIYVTRDGGLSWSEKRVLVAPGQFVGAIRPAGTPVRSTVEEPSLRYVPSFASGVMDVYEDSDSAPHWFAPQLGPVRSAYDDGMKGTSFGMTGGGGGGDSARLGVGLRAGSPYLTLALRKKRGWAMGINIKQTLAMKAKPPIAIAWIDINPNNPNEALAATFDGLLRTTDGGESWPIALTGATAWERMTLHVVRNPHNGREIYVSTGLGLIRSIDGGQTFGRVTDSRLAQMGCRWVTIHPKDPNRIYVGTWGGLFMSTDGGKNYEWVFVRPWPAQNRINRIAVDPADADRVLIGTDDGLFVTQDGGKTFQRGGGLQFTGWGIRALSASGRPGHFIVGDWRDVWETFDGGMSWSVVYYSPTLWDMRHSFFSTHEPGAIWILTSAEILKMTERAVPQVPAHLYAQFAAHVRREPTNHEAIRAALNHTGVDKAEFMGYLKRARYQAFIPEVVAGVRWRSIDGSGIGQTYFIPETNRYAQLRRENGRFIFSAMAKWDLRKMIFTQDETPKGRWVDVNGHIEWAVRATVINLYLERRRLQFERFANTADDSRTKLLRGFGVLFVT